MATDTSLLQGARSRGMIMKSEILHVSTYLTHYDYEYWKILCDFKAFQSDLFV